MNNPNQEKIYLKDLTLNEIYSWLYHYSIRPHATLTDILKNNPDNLFEILTEDLDANGYVDQNSAPFEILKNPIEPVEEPVPITYLEELFVQPIRRDPNWIGFTDTVISRFDNTVTGRTSYNTPVQSLNINASIRERAHLSRFDSLPTRVIIDDALPPF